MKFLVVLTNDWGQIRKYYAKPGRWVDTADQATDLKGPDLAEYIAEAINASNCPKRVTWIEHEENSDCM